MSAAYRPDPKLPALGPKFADRVDAADFPQTNLRYRNDRAAMSVGLDDLTDAEWVANFGRFEPLPDNIPRPLAMRYHGHQFRTYNPDLGDGRGFLFAQLRDDAGRLLDLGTKGSGQTPWSRAGDGRLTLKGGVREVLASAMLEARGVYTSKTFSLIETGEALMRGDEPSPTRSAVMVRLSHSHIRFGSFQRHAYNRDAEALAALIEHAITEYHPDADGPVGLFTAIIAEAARLSAQWMAAGFVHGVLNTDNLNVTGESFDYGPYRFLPTLDPALTAAYFDRTGLYAYGRQPGAVFWALQALGSAFAQVAETDALIAAMEDFTPAYERAIATAIFARLGLTLSDDAEANAAFARATFGVLRATQAPFEPFFHAHFGGGASDDPAFADWRAQRDAFTPSHAPLTGAPCDLLYDEIEAIWAAIAERDDWGPFHEKLAAIEIARRAQT